MYNLKFDPKILEPKMYEFLSTYRWRVILVAWLGFVGPTSAQAGWLKVCNDGETELGLIVAEGTFGIFSSIRQRVSGIYSISAGDCLNNFRTADTAWALSFIARDSERRLVPVEYDFRAVRRDYVATSVCGPDLVLGSRDFSYWANASMRNLGNDCKLPFGTLFPVSGTFLFGDNDGVVRVGSSYQQIDRLADTYYFGRDPEADRLRLETQAQKEREQREALAEINRLRAEQIAREKKEKEERERREADLVAQRKAKRLENAASDFPTVTLKFGAAFCEKGVYPAIEYHLFIPQSDGSFKSETILHRASSDTTTLGHREKVVVPRGEDGKVVVFWYATALSRGRSTEPDRVIWGDTQVNIGTLGELLLHKKELDPLYANGIGIVCAVDGSGPYSQTVRKRGKSVMARWSYKDDFAMRGFAEEIISTGFEYNIWSNQILRDIIKKRFVPLEGQERSELLATLGKNLEIEGLELDPSIQILQADLPFFRDIRFYYAVRLSRGNRLFLPFLSGHPAGADTPFFEVFDRTNEPVYLAAVAERRAGGLILNAETVEAYRTVFFTLVEGKYGRMSPLHNAEIYGRRLDEGGRLTEVEGLISSCLEGGIRKEGDRLAVPSAFRLRGAVVCQEVQVTQTGLIEMGVPEILISDLPSFGNQVEIGHHRSD